MQRTGSGTSQDSDDGKIGSDAGGGVNYLGRARAKARPLSRRVVEEEAISADEQNDDNDDYFEAYLKKALPGVVEDEYKECSEGQRMVRPPANLY